MKPEDSAPWMRGAARWAPYSASSGKAVPLNLSPDGGTARPDDPSCREGLDRALMLMREHRLPGVGVFIASDDPITVVRIDGCRDPESGRLEPKAAATVAALNSYAEASPSGEDVHVFLGGKPPGGRKHRGKVRLLTGPCFVPVTGRRLPEAPLALHGRQAELAQLFPPRDKPATRDDEEVLRLFRDGPEARLYERLMRGDESLWSAPATSYESKEAVDLLLCDRLVLYGGPDVTAGQVERLFARSALARTGEWPRDAAYRELTVRMALKARSAPRHAPEPTPPPERELTEGELARATKLALARARQGKGCERWRLAFDLARDLKAFPGAAPQQFEQAARACAREAGHAEEQFYYDFEERWEVVRMPAGQDPLGLAMEQTDRRLCVPKVPLHLLAHKVFSLAQYLDRMELDDVILLPQGRLAAWLGVTQQDVSLTVKKLIRVGALRLVKEGRYTEKKANEYAFGW